MGLLSRHSHIWRTVDLRVASNRFAVFAFAIVTVTATFLVAELQDVGLGTSVVGGLRYGVGAFLAWAIGRELDPDRTATARLAVLAYLVVAWLGVPDLAAVAAVLLAARVVVRTTGRPPTRVDLVVLVLVAGLAATSTAGFVAALGLAWAVHVDRRLSDPAPDREFEVAAATTAAVAIAVTMVAGAFTAEWEVPSWLTAIVLVATGVAAASLRAATVSSVADRTRAPLDIDRLTHARRLVLVVLLAAVVWSGSSAVAALAPAFAAVIGAGAVASKVLTRFTSSLATD